MCRLETNHIKKRFGIQYVHQIKQNGIKKLLRNLNKIKGEERFHHNNQEQKR